MTSAKNHAHTFIPTARRVVLHSHISYIHHHHNKRSLIDSYQLNWSPTWQVQSYMLISVTFFKTMANANMIISDMFINTMASAVLHTYVYYIHHNHIKSTLIYSGCSYINHQYGKCSLTYLYDNTSMASALLHTHISYIHHNHGNS